MNATKSLFYFWGMSISDSQFRLSLGSIFFTTRRFHGPLIAFYIFCPLSHMVRLEFIAQILHVGRERVFLYNSPCLISACPLRSGIRMITTTKLVQPVKCCVR